MQEGYIWTAWGIVLPNMPSINSSGENSRYYGIQ